MSFQWMSALSPAPLMKGCPSTRWYVAPLAESVLAFGSAAPDTPSAPGVSAGKSSAETAVSPLPVLAVAVGISSPTAERPPCSATGSSFFGAGALYPSAGALAAGASSGLAASGLAAAGAAGAVVLGSAAGAGLAVFGAPPSTVSAIGRISLGGWSAGQWCELSQWTARILATATLGVCLCAPELSQ